MRKLVAKILGMEKGAEERERQTEQVNKESEELREEAREVINKEKDRRRRLAIEYRSVRQHNR